MQNIENNALIAEFMGWKEMTHTKSKNWMLSETIDGIEYAKKESSLANMRFNYSWDWLMPVVQKIKACGAMHSGFLYNCLINATLEKTYNDVVGFIKWYNLNK